MDRRKTILSTRGKRTNSKKERVYLRKWQKDREKRFAPLEFFKNERHHFMSYTYKYPRPAVTADVVAITKEEEPKVLLIQRGFEPYQGCWAFPGGFMEMNETIEECAIRELQEETGLKLASMVQVGAYSKVDRDPRGRTITIAYLAVVDEPLSVIAQDDAAMVEWFSIKNLPTLAFDHNEIMTDAISMYNKIQNK